MANNNLLSRDVWSILESIYVTEGTKGCFEYLRNNKLPFIPKSTITSHMSDYKIKFNPQASTSVATEEKVVSDDSIRESVRYDLKLKSLQSERDIYKRKYEAAIKDASLESRVLDLLKSYRDVVPTPKLKQLNVDTPKIVSTKETIAIILTDWHVGETVSAEAMHNANKYDIPTFLARMEEIAASLIDICFHKLQGYKFQELRVYLTGDLVNGMFQAMHDELIITQSADLAETVYGAATVLVQFIARMLEYFETIHISAAPGNHGRMQKKPMAKMQHLNWDIIVPQIASTYFAGEKRVTWNIPNSFFFIDEVRHQKILGFHGHQVKGWASIPWYGINKTVNNLTDLIDTQYARTIENAVRKGLDIDLNDLRSLRINHVVMGHFHTEAIFDRSIDGEIIAGPCLKGADEFTLSAGFRPASAGQTMFGIHENHGITHRWRLNVQDVYEPKGDFSWYSGGVLGDTWGNL